MPRPTIELSMIVRNGGAALERCLRSARPLVDRIVIGDTGSIDESRVIAAKYGAEVVSIPWNEDFAAARNQVLARAQCDWILVLDADEMLDSYAAASVLPVLVQDEAVHAYTLPRWDYVDRLHRERSAHTAKPNRSSLPEARRYPGYVPSFHTRLFRRNPEVYFRECVHEQVTDRIDQLGLHRTAAPLVIHHFGHVETPAELREEKIRLYHRLGLRKVSRDPRSFEAQLQLGIVELFQMNHPERALPHLQDAAALRPKDGRAALYQGICLLRLARLAEAQQSLLRAFALGESSAALHDALGDCFLRSGEYQHALAAYRKAHACGSGSAVAEAKTGAAEVHVGEVALGLERIRRAIARDPESPVLKGLLEVSERTAAALA